MKTSEAVKNPDWQIIAGISIELQVPGIAGDLIRKYPQFALWSGSHHPKLHHYGDGGLVLHTREVIQIGLSSIKTLQLDLKNQIDPAEYFLATLFHDTGKMFDYSRNPQAPDAFCHEYQPDHHKRIIHHISRSGLIWHDCVQKYPALNEKYHDSVFHAILAHHGQREWGSPVAPFTRTAWLLHLSDGISARMNDADKIDHLKKDKLT